MSRFAGGSAWAMAKDIATGFVLPTARTLERMRPAELDQLRFELDRKMRGIRGDQPDLDDIQALQDRNRQLQRLTTAQRMVMESKRRRRR
jgi:hypothetical protein